MTALRFQTGVGVDTGHSWPPLGVSEREKKHVQKRGGLASETCLIGVSTVLTNRSTTKLQDKTSQELNVGNRVKCYL